MNLKSVKAYFSALGVILVIAGGIMEITGSSSSGSVSNRWSGSQHTATITGYSVIFFGVIFLLIWLFLENMKSKKK